jgi:hypothetical protein
VKANVSNTMARFASVAAAIGLLGCAAAPATIDGTATGTTEQPITITTCRSDRLQIANATASSVESSHFVAANVLDGDYTTRWSSQKGNPQWLQLDLGSRSFIYIVAIDWQTAYSTNYEVQISDNASSWAPVVNVPNATGGSQWHWRINASARYIRIYSKAATAWGNVSITDVAVFGDANTACDASTAACGGVVRLSAANATASSTESSSLQAKNAIDPAYSTRWSSAASDNQWLAIDLGAVSKVDTVRLTWQSSYAKTYSLQTGTSMTGPWTTIYTNAAGVGGVEEIPSLNAQTRYLRIVGTKRATSYGISLWNVDVYGSRDLVCENILKGPWQFKTADCTADVPISDLYAIDGNKIDLPYSDHTFYWDASTGFSGLTFEQPAAGIKVGSKYRLVLDIVTTSDLPSIFWARLSGAGAPVVMIPADGALEGNGQMTMDFDVTQHPGTSPVVTLTNHPALVGFGPYVTGMGMALGSITVTTTLKSIP